MPKATDTFTPSRRQMLGGLGAIAAITTVATPALAAAQSHSDAALLAACAEYHRVHAEWLGPVVSDDWTDHLTDMRDEVLKQIATLTPVTDDGLRAKAGVAYGSTVWILAWSVTKNWREDASPEELIATDVLGQMAGSMGS